MNGCVYNAIRNQPAKPEPIAYDGSGVLRLFFYGGMGQGCPVGPRKILTARHVGTREQGEDVGRQFAVWSTPDGVEGKAWTKDYDYYRDVAEMATEVDLPFVYPIADSRPAIGERVAIYGYEFRPGKVALSPRRIESVVESIVSNTLVLKTPGMSGFSGSCVLNFQSELVGIYHSRIFFDEKSVRGMASIVTDEWGSVGWVPPAPPEPTPPAVLEARPIP